MAVAEWLPRWLPLPHPPFLWATPGPIPLRGLVELRPSGLWHSPEEIEGSVVALLKRAVAAPHPILVLALLLAPFLLRLRNGRGRGLLVVHCLPHLWGLWYLLAPLGAVV